MPRRPSLLIAAIAIWLLAIDPMHEGDILTERLLADAADAELQSVSFLEGALIASGAGDEREVASWVKQYRVRRSFLLANLARGSAVDRLKAIHSDLHTQVLKGRYRGNATDLR